ncbi:MAG TPA: hypothetical protein VMU68_11545 [Acidimicrobiales bacterium]|nr:hypothetical protein [Acidimicrobiales bacterium]
MVPDSPCTAGAVTSLTAYPVADRSPPTVTSVVNEVTGTVGTVAIGMNGSGATIAIGTLDVSGAIGFFEVDGGR